MNTNTQYLVGDSVPVSTAFSFAAASVFTGLTVRWSLIDQDGRVFGEGQANDITQQQNSFVFQVKVSSILPIPSDLPLSNNDTRYKLRWELDASQLSAPILSYEEITVVGLTTAPQGPEHSVEMEGDTISVGISLQERYTSVGFEMFSGNFKIVQYTAVTAAPVRTSTGFYYNVVLDPGNLPGAAPNLLLADLTPYLVAWKYWNSSAPGVVHREATHIFISNGSLLAVLEDVRRQVAKARTTLFGFPDMIFDNPTIFGWLRRGRDMFNAAGGYPTDFTMLNATGGIREFWLRYSEIAMLRAQALAEGEKAFNFSGAAISLDVDRAQYYNQLADTLQSQLDQEVKPYKANLLKKGTSGGDGDASQLSNNGIGRVGISIHPASQYGRLGGYYIR